MLTKKVLGAASAALVALGVAAGPASADSLIYKGSGSLVPVGATITGTSTDSTLQAGLITVSCDQSTVTGTLSTNPGVDVVGTGLSISFSDAHGNCHENILTHSVPGADGTAAVAIADAANMTFTLQNMSVDLHLRGLPNLECTYTGNVTGNINNTNSTVVFNSAPVTSASGFPCPGNGNFSATYQLSGPGGLLELIP